MKAIISMLVMMSLLASCGQRESVSGEATPPRGIREGAEPKGDSESPGENTGSVDHQAPEACRKVSKDQIKSIVLQMQEFRESTLQEFVLNLASIVSKEISEQNIGNGQGSERELEEEIERHGNYAAEFLTCLTKKLSVECHKNTCFIKENLK